MATILRDWSYRYQWLYDGISRLAALSVGGEARFRQLALQGLTIHSDSQVLDLCCGSGQTTEFLAKTSRNRFGCFTQVFATGAAKCTRSFIHRSFC